MKHGKRPTRDQKKLLRALGLDPYDWLISENTPENIVLVHRHLNEHRTIIKSQVASLLKEREGNYEKR